MSRFRLGAGWFFAAVGLVFLAGCGQETVHIADTTAPFVVSTIPAHRATGVALNTPISATFSEAVVASTVNTSTFTISSPAGPVTGAIALSGDTATFTPTAALTADTDYTLTITTGVTDLAGNHLVQNYVWDFATTEYPEVISTIPANGATGVPVGQIVSATFLQDVDNAEENLNCATFTTTTFTLTSAAGTVAGTVACDATDATVTFTPAAPLTQNTLYTATITSGATNVRGNGLIVPYVWMFTTGPQAAVVPPTVISTDPVNNAVGVAVNQSLTATFSVAMNPATINTTTFTLTGPGGVAIPGVVTYVTNGSTATFTPAATLAPNTTFVATITTGAQDTATPPDSLAANYVWSFTTGIAPDTTPPQVISTVPPNGATGVAINSAISATFSEAMTPASLNGATFTLNGPGATPVAGTVTYATVGDTATFTPLANLAINTLYTATITTGAMDLSGNALAANYVWTFTTGTGPDITPPTIVSTNPADMTTNVLTTATVNATFSEAMDPMTITPGTFTLYGPGGLVAGTVAYDSTNFIATFLPAMPLAINTTYVAQVSAGATDLAGNALAPGAVPNPWSFTTGTGSGTVIGTSPPVNLGTAALFAVFGGDAGITNSGTNTVINGDAGTTGISTLVTGLHDAGPGCSYSETPTSTGLVNGSIDTAPPPPTGGCPAEGTAATLAIALQAKLDALAAYADLTAFPNGLDVSTCAGCGGGAAGELGNRTLPPGTYKSTVGTYGITTGDLTLDAQGDPNALWVFQTTTSLTVGTATTPRNVILINGAQSKNVFWEIGTAATINAIQGGGTMEGTILAPSGISISTAGVAAVTTINGRALALQGPVTMVNTVVNVPGP